MLECLTELSFWTQASIHVGIVLFVLGSIALVNLTSKDREIEARAKLPSSNGKALVLHTRDGSSILSGSTRT